MCIFLSSTTGAGGGGRRAERRTAVGGGAWHELFLKQLRPSDMTLILRAMKTKQQEFKNKR